MRNTFQFRLKPTRAQERQLEATLAACRFVYNWGIEDRRNLWDYCKVSTGFFDQSKFLPHLKALHPFLKDVHAHPLQEALRRVDRTFERYFQARQGGKRHGRPRFKEWGNGAKLDGKRLELSKIGRVRIHLHRPLEGEIKTCTIKKRADGWVALFSAEISPSWRSINENPAVGIDVGILSFAALSSGDRIPNPRYLEAQRRELRIAQRKVSRRVKGFPEAPEGGRSPGADASSNLEAAEGLPLQGSQEDRQAVLPHLLRRLERERDGKESPTRPTNIRCLLEFVSGDPLTLG